MADPVSMVLIGSAIIGAGSSVIGGIQQNKAAKQQANALEEQGRIAQEEANREAQLHADDVRRFRALQTVAFTKNGVTLGGSPLLVLDDTTRRGQEEVDSIARSGAAERRLYNQRAANTRSEGRAALIGGITSGAGQVASAAFMGQQAGLFSKGATSGGGFSEGFARDTVLSRS